MILALSRFRVKNGMEAAVRAAFEGRPRRVETTPGFLGLEVYTETTAPAGFVLVTRWRDEASYRAWHDGPEHHTSHALIPRGLKLDPIGTSLVLAERIDAATSGGSIGNVLLDHAAPLGRLIEGGAWLHLIALDASGNVVAANAAVTELAGRPILGLPVDALVVDTSVAALREALANPTSKATLIHFRDRHDAPVTLRCTIEGGLEGHTIVGEPTWDHHRDYVAELEALNAELATLAREHARRGRALERANAALEAAHRELRDTHWHLRKVASVLPMCMRCHKVHGDTESWEEVATFLTRNSTFISHGYCSTCAAEIEADPVDS